MKEWKTFSSWEEKIRHWYRLSSYKSIVHVCWLLNFFYKPMYKKCFLELKIKNGIFFKIQARWEPSLYFAAPALNSGLNLIEAQRYFQQKAFDSWGLLSMEDLAGTWKKLKTTAKCTLSSEWQDTCLLYNSEFFYGKNRIHLILSTWSDCSS